MRIIYIIYNQANIFWVDNYLSPYFAFDDFIWFWPAWGRLCLFSLIMRWFSLLLRWSFGLLWRWVSRCVFQSVLRVWSLLFQLMSNLSLLLWTTTYIFVVVETMFFSKYVTNKKNNSRLPVRLLEKAVLFWLPLCERAAFLCRERIMIIFIVDV